MQRERRDEQRFATVRRHGEPQRAAERDDGGGEAHAARPARAQQRERRGERERDQRQVVQRQCLRRERREPRLGVRTRLRTGNARGAP